MSKKISELKRKEIRCLVVENFEDNIVYKIHDKDKMKEILETHLDIEITKVYNPNNDIKAKIYDLMDRKLEGDKAKSKINEIDMLIKVIPLLTDIEIDLDEKDDIEAIREIISDPNDVFSSILEEINKIILKMNLDWIENLKVIGQLPDDVLKVLAKVNNEELENGKETV